MTTKARRARLPRQTCEHCSSGADLYASSTSEIFIAGLIIGAGAVVAAILILEGMIQ